MNPPLTKLQQNIVDAVNTSLSDYYWFKHVDITNLPDDATINRLGFDFVMENVKWDTIDTSCPL